MLIRIEQGKGGKDRYVMLSPQLLRDPARLLALGRPAHGCFPGVRRASRSAVATLQAACRVGGAASRARASR